MPFHAVHMTWAAGAGGEAQSALAARSWKRQTRERPWAQPPPRRRRAAGTVAAAAAAARTTHGGGGGGGGAQRGARNQTPAPKRKKRQRARELERLRAEGNRKDATIAHLERQLSSTAAAAAAAPARAPPRGGSSPGRPVAVGAAVDERARARAHLGQLKKQLRAAEEVRAPAPAAVASSLPPFLPAPLPRLECLHRLDRAAVMPVGLCARGSQRAKVAERRHHQLQRELRTARDSRVASATALRAALRREQEARRSAEQELRAARSEVAELSKRLRKEQAKVGPSVRLAISTAAPESALGPRCSGNASKQTRAMDSHASPLHPALSPRVNSYSLHALLSPVRLVWFPWHGSYCVRPPLPSPPRGGRVIRRWRRSNTH